MRLHLVVAIVGAVGCGESKTVRQSDVVVWRDVPLIELETHPIFSAMPKQARKLSTGEEMWTFTACNTSVTDARCTTLVGSNWATTHCRGAQRVSYCCDHQFLVHEKVVSWYQPTGSCYTDCDARPSSRQCTDDEKTQ